jgi:hypothetical protein
MNNRLPAYYDSNEKLYLHHSENRAKHTIKWITCVNYHVLSYIQNVDPIPDPKNCEKCKIKTRCKCDADVIFATGCKCGGT